MFQLQIIVIEVNISIVKKFVFLNRFSHFSFAFLFYNRCKIAFYAKQCACEYKINAGIDKFISIP